MDPILTSVLTVIGVLVAAGIALWIIMVIVTFALARKAMKSADEALGNIRNPFDRYR